MNDVSLWASIIIGITVLVLSILSAATMRELNEFSRHEALGFLRLLLVGGFAIMISQALSRFGWHWSVLLLGSLGSTGVLLFSSQLLAKFVGHRKFGQALGNLFRPFVKSLDILFSPIASKNPEALEEFEQEFLESVEDFGETVVREIMVPRIDMETVTADSKLDATLKDFMRTGYSRLPVRGKNIDDLVGVLYLKDVARVFTDSPGKLSQLSAGEQARKAMFVPDSKPVEEVLKDMQLNATHVAIAIDEYGGVAGLVTMEDVIEELVGEITDEYDRERPDIEPIGANRYRVSAKSSLFELGEHIGLELEDEDIDSVGGLVTKMLGRLPRGGDQVHVSGLTFIAERFEGRDHRLVSVVVAVDESVIALKEDS